jgi:hypothetical protein
VLVSLGTWWSDCMEHVPVKLELFVETRVRLRDVEASARRTTRAISNFAVFLVERGRVRRALGVVRDFLSLLTRYKRSKMKLFPRPRPFQTLRAISS